MASRPRQMVKLGMASTFIRSANRRRHSATALYGEVPFIHQLRQTDHWRRPDDRRQRATGCQLALCETMRDDVQRYLGEHDAD
jgi:hypothetical protein